MDQREARERAYLAVFALLSAALMVTVIWLRVPMFAAWPVVLVVVACGLVGATRV